jgi:chorismate synthase
MNSFGRLFRISIFGESHGAGVGILVDGCPAGLRIAPADFEKDLERRKGEVKGTTLRKEPDKIQIRSGFFEGKTTGTPLLILFDNILAHPEDYEPIRYTPRPGHADFSAWSKFGGWHDFRGGGHFSGRLTVGLVAAGVVAKKLISPVIVKAWLAEAGGDTNIKRAVTRALKKRDSIGGLVAGEVVNVPAGIGEPFFDSVESLLSHLLFAVPGVKGVEFGAGFTAAGMTGSRHNDPILDATGKTKTNHSGGINGGITNGNPLVFRVAVKPTSTIPQLQKTIDLRTGKKKGILVTGRHDACIALRVPVVVEAAAAIVLADLMLLEQKIKRIIK